MDNQNKITVIFAICTPIILFVNVVIVTLLLVGKISSTHFEVNVLTKIAWIMLVVIIILDCCWSIPSIYISSLFADYSSIQRNDG